MFLLITIGLIQCRKVEDNNQLYSFLFLTEEYKPFNYTEDGRLTGLGPEVLREICSGLKIPFEVTVLPWNEAYQTTLQTANAILFSTVLNAERKDLFKWAGPIASLDYDFYSTAQNHLIINSFEDARNVGQIGVVTDYGITQYLEGQGFTNLVYFENNAQVLDKLLNGEIDLFPSDRLSITASLEELGYSYYAVSPRFRVLTDLMYFAFNKNISDEVVADFQQKINQLKDNGRLKELYQEFIQSSEYPGKLLIYTEDYPPLTFMNSYGEISGFGTDIVREIMGRNNVYASIKLSQWRIGYELALNNPEFCLFTMDRTAIRDTLFRWVGPLGSNTTYFFTKVGSGITINSLEEAKELDAVGTVSSWFSDQYLRELGFTNLVSDGDPLVVTEKLMQGEIDAFVCSALTFPDILRSLGYQPEQVVASYALMSSDFYIAFSLGTSGNTVTRWQQTFDNMKADGTYDNIYLKWFPDDIRK